MELTAQETRPIRVLVVDDDESVRRLLKLSFSFGDAGLQWVGEATNGYEAVVQAEALEPDLIILDHMMPIRSGAEAIVDLRQKCPDTEILIFSAYLDAPDANALLSRLIDEFDLPAVPKGNFTDLESALGVLASRRRARMN